MAAAPTPPVLAAKLADPRFAKADYSISIAVAGVGEVASLGGDRLLMPASNQKLWTAAGARLLLPSEFTFPTAFYTTGSISNGVLSGDLVVVGGGDPTITTAGKTHSLDALAETIKERGILRIDGRVVIDETRFDTVRTPGGWEPWQLEFVGPLSAFMVDWNNIRKEVEFMEQPTLKNAERFIERLSKAGVEVARGPAVEPKPPGATLLFTESAGSLTKLLTFMLSESDNVMSESFVREIGWRVKGRGTTPDGLAAIDEAIAARLCLPRQGINDDGSGVSHYSRHSARYFRTLLEVLPTSDLLAVSGKTGTLKSRLSAPDVAGRVAAKTGTVRGGRSLSGYATTASGRTATFSILANGDEAQLSSKLIDELVETIVREL